MRIIFLLGILAILAGWQFKLTGLELVILSITVMLVFTAEIFNTAIEILMDMFTVKYHARVKLIKDIGAAAVLLTVLNSLLVGYFLFIRRIFK